MQDQLYGGVELGGTKVVCVIGKESGEITAQTKLQTTEPNDTLAAIAHFFKEHSPTLSGLGIGSFGPLQLGEMSEHFGYTANTPKLKWENVDIKGQLEKQTGVKVSIDTDVNCAALGEYYFGVARGVANFVYLTVGTGIGGGIMIDGKLDHGLSNVEIGHMRIPHERFTDSFVGVCPFHKDCLEGIASGPAMEMRWAQKPEDLDDAEAWEIEAEHLAAGIDNLVMTLAPKLVILGGGVMKHEGLIEAIRENLTLDVNDYIKLPAMEDYVVSSSSDMNAALGALKLAASGTQL